MPTGPRTAILTMSSPGGGSSSGTPGGADTQVQFNDGGSFGGDAGLVFNKTTNALTVGGVMSADDVDAVDDLTVGGDTTLQGNLDLDSDAGLLRLGEAQDVVLQRDGAADVLALKRSTNTQELRIYKTDDGAGNYERAVFELQTGGSNQFIIKTEAGGTGGNRSIHINASSNTTRIGGTGGDNLEVGRIYMTGSATALQLSGHESEINLGSAMKIRFSDNVAYNGTIDITLKRIAAGVLGIRGPSDLSTGAAWEWLEQTAPSAGASNTVRVYAQDNGGGKTQLMALFNSGAAQQIAIEP